MFCAPFLLTFPLPTGPICLRPSRIRKLCAILNFIADLRDLLAIWVICLGPKSWILGSVATTTTITNPSFLPPRLAPTADSPAAALIEALEPEVLAQVLGAYGGLRDWEGLGDHFLGFSLEQRSAAKIGTDHLYIE